MKQGHYRALRHRDFSEPLRFQAARSTVSYFCTDKARVGLNIAGQGFVLQSPGRVSI